MSSSPIVDSTVKEHWKALMVESEKNLKSSSDIGLRFSCLQENCNVRFEKRAREFS